MAMVTISLELPEELAERLTPLQDRLPEIIKLGLRQLEDESKEQVAADRATLKRQVLVALRSTGVVTVPGSSTRPQTRIRRTPVKAGGPPAREMIIAERRRNYDSDR